MRRGRGKGKKQNESTREDHESGEEEEKIPSYRRRGRPQKPVRDDFKEEEEEEEEEEGLITSKDLNEKKRKMPLQSNGENVDISEEERLKLGIDDSTKSISIGYRLNGNRRKSKPRRAAEAVVECDQV